MKILSIAASLFIASALMAQTVSYNPLRAPLMVVPASGGANASGYYLVSRSTNAPVNAVNLGALTTGWLKVTVSGGVATPSTSAISRAIGMFFDGGGVALANNQVKYFTWLGGACTIGKWAITVDTGTITYDIWKIASGTAIPTVANTIVASAAPSLAANTAANSTTLTGWTTSVADGDIFAFKITAISGATQSSIILQCSQ